MKSLITLFLLTFSLGASAQNNWKLEKTEGNIKAYSRLKEGKDYFEFRAVFRVSASLKEATDLVFDVAEFKNWMPNAIESRVLKKLNDSIFIAYTVTSAPKPTSNRDAVFKVTKRKTGEKSYSVIMQGKPDYYPQQSGRVRVKEYYAIWKIIEVSPNLLEIDYSASFDPGKNVPNWVVKNSLIDARIDISKKVIEKLKK